jgi:hypothetical protein
MGRTLFGIESQKTLDLVEEERDEVDSRQTEIACFELFG